MSGPEASESTHGLLKRARLHEYRFEVCAFLVLVGLLGFPASMAVATSTTFGPTVKLVGHTSAIVAAICFVAGIGGCIFQHKRCSPLSKELLARTKSWNRDLLEPIVEGELLGSFEVLSCDESLLMLSRNRSHATEIVIRISLLLSGIGVTLGLILAVKMYGFDFGGLLLRNPKAILLYGSPLVSLLLIFLALRRRPSRWYASREEGIVRIETIRWIGSREIEDLRPGDIKLVFRGNEDLAIGRLGQNVKPVQHISVPNLTGLFMSKEEREKALNTLRDMQCCRVHAALCEVFRGHPDWKAH